MHVPVLLREVLEALELRRGLSVVDGTVGAGGHSREIIQRIRPDGRLIGLDRDPMMLQHAASVVSGADVVLRQASYQELPQVMAELQIPAVDRVLLDLGLSSDQLADRSRGFGIDAGGTLDMRFDTAAGESAGEWLARSSEGDVARQLREFGEVGSAERVAKEIKQFQRAGRLNSAEDLTAAIVAADPRARRDKTVIAQVFQAIRIAVNEELSHLATFLDEVLPRCLAPGGRVAIISFHSLEDRMVKQAFSGPRWQVQTRKPIEATPAESRFNPRSRTARLRVAVLKSDS